MNHINKVVVIPYKEWKANKKHMEEENVITLQTKKLLITKKTEQNVAVKKINLKKKKKEKRKQKDMKMKMNQALNVKKQKVKVKKVKPIVPLVMKNNEEKELQGQGKANDDVNIVNIGKEKDEEDEQFYIKQLSNILRKNAYSLFSFIKSKNIFKWNSAGEIIKSDNKPLKK